MTVVYSDIFSLAAKSVFITEFNNGIITIFNKFTACYNRCVKKFFGYRRMDSMTGIFLDLSLPTALTILHNSRLLFTEHCINSHNDIVTFLNSVGV